MKSICLLKYKTLMLFILVFFILILIAVPGFNKLKFNNFFEDSIGAILMQYELEIDSIEYSKLDKDRDKYMITVYIKYADKTYQEIYSVLKEAERFEDTYCLDDKFRIIEGQFYNQTIYNSVFVDYIIGDNEFWADEDHARLLMNGEEVYSESQYTYSEDRHFHWIPSLGCNYGSCELGCEKGKPYCSRHCCHVDSCLNDTEPGIDYCHDHNCKYPTCNARIYTNFNEDYCERHYEDFK